MPPPPRFQSPRAQTVAVAVIAGLFLLGATGLAKLQAGNGPAYFNTPIDRVQRLPQSGQAGSSYILLIDTPAHWQSSEHPSDQFIATDPDKPDRRITVLFTSYDEPVDPGQAALRFLEQQLDPAAKESFQPVSKPIVFSLPDVGLHGVQLIGVSQETDGRTRQHLLACLTFSGQHYWWIYLTDTVDVGGDEVQALRANVKLLQSVYRSARITQESSSAHP